MAYNGADPLSFQTLEELWDEEGGPAQWAPTMAAVPYYESSATPDEVQQGQPYGTTGWGLWQITPGNSEPQAGTNSALLNPFNNAKAAVAKFKSQGIGAWTDTVGDASLAQGGTPLSVAQAEALVRARGSELGGQSLAGLSASDIKAVTVSGVTGPNETTTPVTDSSTDPFQIFHLGSGSADNTADTAVESIAFFLFAAVLIVTGLVIAFKSDDTSVTLLGA